MIEPQNLSEWMDDVAARFRKVFRESWGEPKGTPDAPRPMTGRVDLATLRNGQALAPFIDHTLLKPEATREEVLALCAEAREHGFATVCINSGHLKTAVNALQGAITVPICVVGFPLGSGLPSAKAYEAREAVRLGAREIDMVLNIGALKARDYAATFLDISAVVRAVQPVPVKVILETGQLTREEKICGCALAKAAGAAFVKTSTGFGVGGATVEDVALMREIVGEDMGVKASGGIRTEADARSMLAAGANRLGCSASVAIVRGGEGTGSGY